MASLALDLLAVVGSVAALWYGALLLVENATRLARRAGLSEVVVGASVVAVGTSAPEIAVSVDAALTTSSDIAVANVVGSNVFNLGIVLGAVALLRAVPVQGRLLRRDGLVCLGATALALVLLADQTLGVLEAVLLLAGVGGYLLLLARSADPDAVPTGSADADLSTVGRLVVGLALVLGGADLLVRAATDLALVVGVSEWLVGLTVVAAGTSTPELATSLVAARRGSHGVSVGNLVGSSTFNVLAVLGAAGLFGPLQVASNAPAGMLWLLGLTTLALALLWTGRELTRLEGGVLVLAGVARWVIDLL